MNRCKRCEEHEQFRKQHRDCDRMGCEIQQLQNRIKLLEGLVADEQQKVREAYKCIVELNNQIKSK